MSGKELSVALGDISDEKLQDALDVYKRKRKTRNIWLRATSVAAALALILTAFFAPGSDDGIVTAPGVLKVYAYDLTSGSSLENMVSYELEEGMEPLQECKWNSGINVYYGLPLNLSFIEKSMEDENITFDVTVSAGKCYGDIRNNKYKENKDDPVAQLQSADLGDRFVIENGETIFWSDEALLEIKAYQKGTEGICAYVDIVVKADDHIVGYAVIKIKPIRAGKYNGIFFVATLEKTVSFPKVEGKFQLIRQAYVEKKIESMH